MKIKNLRIKQLMKVARLMNRYPALSEAQSVIAQFAQSAQLPRLPTSKQKSCWKQRYLKAAPLGTP